MADPSRQPGRAAPPQTGGAAVGPRVGRLPRPANDNRFPWMKQASRIVPPLVAVALLAWALVHAFGVL
ncbi:MAG TPA: hypothetical protein VGF92_02920 [Stellaceae bacterium]